ncbi:hypothetical protein JQC92_10080 [Shewanella sp. 202IG2-18]|uniref:hypothetical protein n=1 Tax=Parashewanella hymeniacidonis TaxID=2807618 RepID=UPI00195F77A7|nr:hypothetical protein [Parashewanella hymeniacidonis]MBM7072376.1 hypothetical protein [Parashewanella hymeniacidonis]
MLSFQLSATVCPGNSDFDEDSKSLSGTVDLPTSRPLVDDSLILSGSIHFNGHQYQVIFSASCDSHNLENWIIDHEDFTLYEADSKKHTTSGVTTSPTNTNDSEQEYTEVKACPKPIIDEAKHVIAEGFKRVIRLTEKVYAQQPLEIGERPLQPARIIFSKPKADSLALFSLKHKQYITAIHLARQSSSRDQVSLIEQATRCGHTELVKAIIPSFAQDTKQIRD